MCKIQPRNMGDEKYQTLKVVHFSSLVYEQIFINIWFAIRIWNKYILYDDRFSKGAQATHSVKWDELYKWKNDMKYPRYESELLCAQG